MGTKSRTYKIDKENREWIDKMNELDEVEKSFIVRRALKFYREKVIEGSMVDKKYEARKQ